MKENESLNYYKLKRLLETFQNKLNLAQQAIQNMNAKLDAQAVQLDSIETKLNQAGTILIAIKNKVGA